MEIRIVQRFNPDEVNMSNKYIETLAANSRPDKLLIDAFKTIDMLVDELENSKKIAARLIGRNTSLTEAIAIRDIKIDEQKESIDAILGTLQDLIYDYK